MGENPCIEHEYASGERGRILYAYAILSVDGRKYRRIVSVNELREGYENAVNYKDKQGNLVVNRKFDDRRFGEVHATKVPLRRVLRENGFHRMGSAWDTQAAIEATETHDMLTSEVDYVDPDAMSVQALGNESESDVLTGEPVAPPPKETVKAQPVQKTPPPEKPQEPQSQNPFAFRDTPPQTPATEPSKQPEGI